MPAVQRSPRSPSPAQGRAEGEGQHREKAGHNRDLSNTGQREAEVNHVARHVRYKHVPQTQVTKSIDKASHHRQAD